MLNVWSVERLRLKRIEKNNEETDSDGEIHCQRGWQNQSCANHVKVTRISFIWPQQSTNNLITLKWRKFILQMFERKIKRKNQK